MTLFSTCTRAQTFEDLDACCSLKHTYPFFFLSSFYTHTHTHTCCLLEASGAEVADAKCVEGCAVFLLLSLNYIYSNHYYYIIVRSRVRSVFATFSLNTSSSALSNKFKDSASSGLCKLPPPPPPPLLLESRVCRGICSLCSTAGCAPHLVS